MKQLGKRRPDHSITVITESEAKINITVGPPKIDLIQAAGFEKNSSPDCGACAGYG